MATTMTAIEMKPLTISGDKKGFYALMPSQSGGKAHRVNFFEPAKGMPCDFSCDCKGYYFRLKCSHCDALQAYFGGIYEESHKLSEAFKAAKPAPAVETPAPVVETTPATDAKEALAEEIDALLAELEAECDAIVAELEASEPTASPVVEKFHDKLTCGTGYRVDGCRVLINPVTGLFRCGCTGHWISAENGCEHIRLVVSDSARMERRRQEMQSVVDGDAIAEQKEMARAVLAREAMPIASPTVALSEEISAVEHLVEQGLEGYSKNLGTNIRYLRYQVNFEKLNIKSSDYRVLKAALLEHRRQKLIRHYAGEKVFRIA